ncbi:MAG: hypothetical protein H0W47_03800 [Polaromonas sp.]|uniref:hypothetical protein n=1 Tax=Polaromonas sp. TaxID=1869339 RepID=UPI0017FA9B9E|nr:hypothetical protein [Polaromonas sp.]MBA3592907.1 hypothetical protein [Polaromonas sp.]
MSAKLVRLVATKLALTLMTCCLAACSVLINPQTDTAHRIEVDGRSYRVEQITASTWTATPAAVLTGLLPKAASLIQAVEKASGCKVTDSSFSQQSATLSAQVICSQQKN